MCTYAFYLAALAFVAVMAALWVTVMIASMLVMIAALHTLADDTARRIVDRPARSLFYTPTGTGVSFPDRIAMQEAISKENVNTLDTLLIKTAEIELLRSALVKLLPVRTNTNLYTPVIARKNKRKRKFGWFVRSKIFRSDLG